MKLIIHSSCYLVTYLGTLFPFFFPRNSKSSEELYPNRGNSGHSIKRVEIGTGVKSRRGVTARAARKRLRETPMVSSEASQDTITARTTPRQARLHWWNFTSSIDFAKKKWRRGIRTLPPESMVVDFILFFIFSEEIRRQFFSEVNTFYFFENDMSFWLILTSVKRRHIILKGILVQCGTTCRFI